MNKEYNFIEVIILMFACGLLSVIIFDFRQEPEIETKQVTVSDRATSCEEKGGVYNYKWSYYNESYTESCYTKEIIIEDF